jgi:predicted DsbA family dithiol-disulfide isomerase
MIGGLGGVPQFEARMRQYYEYGAHYGLKFNMDIVKYTPNTTLSYQLITIVPEDKKE